MPVAADVRAHRWVRVAAAGKAVASERELLLAQFAEGPARLRAALEAVPADRLMVRPRREKWSPREIALHLCDTEISVAYRFKRALAEPGGPVPAFDQDRWVDALGGFEKLDLALAALAALRAELAALLERLPDAAWQRVSVHPESGPVTVADWLRRFVGHTDNHIRQIIALSAPVTPTPPKA